MRNPISAREECAHTCLLPNKVEEADRLTLQERWLPSGNHSGTSQRPTPAPPAPVLLLYGERRQRWRGECAHREQIQLGPDPQGFCPSDSGPAPTLTGWCLSLGREAALADTREPSSLVPLPTKVTAVSTRWRKIGLLRTSDPALPSRPQGTQTVWGRSHKETPLQDGTGGCFT